MATNIPLTSTILDSLLQSGKESVTSQPQVLGDKQTPSVKKRDNSHLSPITEGGAGSRRRLEGQHDTESIDSDSDKEDIEMETEAGTEDRKTENQKQRRYRRKNDRPLSEGEVLIKIVNNTEDSPISACKTGSVSLIKRTLKQYNIAELADMGTVQVNPIKKWTTMTLKKSTTGQSTETTINKLLKGHDIDLGQIEGNTQVLWTITQITKIYTGLIKNMDPSENIQELEEYLKDQNPEVKSIRRLGTSHNVQVIFESSEQPPRIDTPFGPRTVYEYVRTPPLCMKCYKYGHTTKQCDKESELCANCGQTGHKAADCTETQKCPQCGNPGHNAWSADCPKRVQMRNRQKDHILRALSWDKQNKTETFTLKKQDFPKIGKTPHDAQNVVGQTEHLQTFETNNTTKADNMTTQMEIMRDDFNKQVESINKTIENLTKSLTDMVTQTMKDINTTISGLGTHVLEKSFVRMNETIETLGNTITETFKLVTEQTAKSNAEQAESIRSLKDVVNVLCDKVIASNVLTPKTPLTRKK